MLYLKITELFVGSDQALPLPTQIVISFSQAVVNYWWLLPIAIIGIIYYVGYVSASNNKHKRFWHGIFLRIPLLKELIIRAETAKFANSLSTLISNGVNMQSALPIANATLTNMVFSNNLHHAIEGFKEGKSLHGIMSKVDHFPVLATQMINVGEETGELESMLARIAEIYEREGVQCYAEIFISSRAFVDRLFRPNHWWYYYFNFNGNHECK